MRRVFLKAFPLQPKWLSIHLKKSICDLPRPPQAPSDMGILQVRVEQGASPLPRSTAEPELALVCRFLLLAKIDTLGRRPEPRETPNLLITALPGSERPSRTQNFYDSRAAKAMQTTATLKSPLVSLHALLQVPFSSYRLDAYDALRTASPLPSP